MIIAIPSYKRPNDCKTAKLVPQGVIFCHEFEAQEYRDNNENEVVAIPDDLQKKGMAVIRNFILDNTDDDNVLMLDDDIAYFGYYEKLELVKLNNDELIEFIGNAFRMAQEAKTRLWGLNLQSDKKFYREYSPFSLTSVVLGPCFGVIKDPRIRFDERLGLKEDYDYSLQVAYKYRKILRFNKYHYSCGHIKVKGGCSTYRNAQLENEQAEKFQKKWGKKVVKIKRKTQNGNFSINPVVHIPISGI